MPKTAYFPELLQRQPQMYGKTYPGYCPTAGYVFAFDSSDLMGMSAEFIKVLRTQPYEERIDAAWVLGKGAYNWIDPRTLAPNPRSGPGLWLSVGAAPPEQDVLLNMVAIIGTHMAQAFMPPFNMLPYVAHATLVDDVEARGPVDFTDTGLI